MYTQRLVFDCQRSKPPCDRWARALVGSDANIDMNRNVVPVLSSSGGDSGARTRSLRLAKPALSQLSYIPNVMAEELAAGEEMVGLSGLEPPTSRLSGVRSNQLSYRPTLQRLWRSSRLEVQVHSLPRPEPPPGDS